MHALISRLSLGTALMAAILAVATIPVGVTLAEEPNPEPVVDGGGQVCYDNNGNQIPCDGGGGGNSIGPVVDADPFSLLEQFRVLRKGGENGILTADPVALTFDLGVVALQGFNLPGAYRFLVDDIDDGPGITQISIGPIEAAEEVENYIVMAFLGEEYPEGPVNGVGGVYGDIWFDNGDGIPGNAGDSRFGGGVTDGQNGDTGGAEYSFDPDNNNTYVVYTIPNSVFEQMAADNEDYAVIQVYGYNLNPN